MSAQRLGCRSGFFIRAQSTPHQQKNYYRQPDQTTPHFYIPTIYQGNLCLSLGGETRLGNYAT
jgi:hypothetical protein